MASAIAATESCGMRRRGCGLVREASVLGGSLGSDAWERAVLARSWCTCSVSCRHVANLMAAARLHATDIVSPGGVLTVTWTPWWSLSDKGIMVQLQV